MLLANRCHGLVLVIGLAHLPVAGKTALGQEQPDVAPDDPAAVPSFPFDYDSEPPYTIYERDWNRRFPAPYRRAFRKEYYPYGRPYPGASRRGRSYYDRYPDDGYGGYGGYAFDGGYDSGFRDGRRYQRWEHRAEMGSKSYLRAMQNGSDFFRGGDYSNAARQFMLACKLNQGDPASRLRAVHALVALGKYEPATPALRRALQLQPRLVHLSLNIQQDYGAPSDFDAHLKGLQAAAVAAQQDASLWLLLGYYQLFSNRAADAADSLTKAVELAPRDKAARMLLEAAELFQPADPLPQSKPQPGVVPT